MQRIVILGCAGAGKTTLAAGIARRTGLPVVHLDVLFWHPGWTSAPQHEARRSLAAALARDRWILDGNFLAAGEEQEDERFDRADAVVFLDRSRSVCFWRVLKRVLLQGGTRRADLPEGCTESLDLPLLRWIWRYPRDDRPRVLGLLERLGGEVSVHRLRSRGDVRRFLRSVGSRGGVAQGARDPGTRTPSEV